MNIHQCFGANLRNLCYRYSSISEVCRGIGINRQQFNKYLAGQCLPNAITLRRICNFLQVNEYQLFVMSELPTPQPPPSEVSQIRRGNERDKGLRDILNGLQFISEGTLVPASGIIQPGLYYCYFPLPNSENFLLRSLIKVKTTANATCFTRLTIFPSHSGQNRYLVRGKHVGIVVANSHEIYFLGYNKMPSHQLSILTFDHTGTGNHQLLGGLALTRTATGRVISRTCLHFLGNSANIRQALRCLGPVSIESPGLEPFVYASMTALSPKFANQLTPVDFNEMLSHTVSEVNKNPLLATASFPV